MSLFYLHAHHLERIYIPNINVAFSGGRIVSDSCSLFSSTASVSSVQFSRSVMSDSLWPHGLQHARLPIHHQLPEPTQTPVHHISDAIQLPHPLLSPSPPAFHLSQLFSNESILCIRWPKDWSFGFSISPSNEYSGLISFRMDWLDLLAVQGTLKSLL